MYASDEKFNPLPSVFGMPKPLYINVICLISRDRQDCLISHKNIIYSRSSYEVYNQSFVGYYLYCRLQQGKVKQLLSAFDR